MGSCSFKDAEVVVVVAVLVAKIVHFIVGGSRVIKLCSHAGNSIR